MNITFELSETPFTKAVITIHEDSNITEVADAIRAGLLAMGYHIDSIMEALPARSEYTLNEEELNTEDH